MLNRVQALDSDRQFDSTDVQDAGARRHITGKDLAP